MLLLPVWVRYMFDMAKPVLLTVTTATLIFKSLIPA
jgi:hypothetical protein